MMSTMNLATLNEEAGSNMAPPHAHNDMAGVDASYMSIAWCNGVLIFERG